MKKLLGSVVILVASIFVLVFPGTSAAYGFVSPGNVIIAQVGSQYGSMMINVVNTCTGQRVPGAIVNVGRAYYVTNTFGSTTFMILPSGSITINVSHSGYHTSSLLASSSTYPAGYTIYLVPLQACYP
ncbi:MAG: hypothetical protein ACLPY5_11335 [Candidatus Bathyarchaeia archaeon]